MRSVISAALRHYPFYRGYDLIALSRPLAVFAHWEVHAIAKLRTGHRMLVYGRDHVGRVLLYMGDFDPRISAIARKLLRPGDCVLDIGANLGWFSFIASAAVGPEGLVHAFEPQPDVSALFRASLAMNGTRNVVLHQVALSDNDGTADLHIPAGNYGAARLGNVSGENWRAVEIRTVNAGAYLSSLRLPSIRLVKIDVEGHEETVFRSAEDFFRKHAPDAVIFESAGHRHLLDRPIAKLLSDYGYELFSFDRSLLQPRLAPASRDRDIPTIDHLALRSAVPFPETLKAYVSTK